MTRRLDEFRQQTLPTPEAGARMLERIEARIEAAPPRRFPRRWVAVGAIAAAAALVIVVGLRLRAPAAPATLLETHELPLSMGLPFDGRVEAAPHSRAEVVLSSKGALVTLSAGTVELSVHHRPDVRWVVSADGYQVTAVGTRFSVERTGGRPVVQVFEGVVRLTGPGLSPDGEPIAAPPATPQAQELQPAPEPAPTPFADAGDDAGRPALRTPPRKGTGWLPLFRELVKNGDTGKALELIPASVPAGCAECSARDLLDVGDLLGAEGQVARAQRAYEQVCPLEPHSATCATAQVRLALQAEQEGRRADAIAWASRYLERNPHGAFAGELLFRRMEWRLELGQRALAKADARALIARLPANRQQVDRAREVLAAP